MDITLVKEELQVLNIASPAQSAERLPVSRAEPSTAVTTKEEKLSDYILMELFETIGFQMLSSIDSVFKDES